MEANPHNASISPAANGAGSNWMGTSVTFEVSTPFICMKISAVFLPARVIPSRLPSISFGVLIGALASDTQHSGLFWNWAPTIFSLDPELMALMTFSGTASSPISALPEATSGTTGEFGPPGMKSGATAFDLYRPFDWAR